MLCRSRFGIPRKNDGQKGPSTALQQPAMKLGDRQAALSMRKQGRRVPA